MLENVIRKREIDLDIAQHPQNGAFVLEEMDVADVGEPSGAFAIISPLTSTA